MTWEEVAEIINYCKECTRLISLGWRNPNSVIVVLWQQVILVYLSYKQWDTDDLEKQEKAHWKRLRRFAEIKWVSLIGLLRWNALCMGSERKFLPDKRKQSFVWLQPASFIFKRRDVLHGNLSAWGESLQERAEIIKTIKSQ